MATTNAADSAGAGAGAGAGASAVGNTPIKLNIGFLHPDLGIGGAERLIVDAAIGLQSIGHSISIYTAHHSINHCFEETRNGILSVTVYGDWLPQSLFNRFKILFAILRNLYTALLMIISTINTSPFDIIIIDQLSISIPLIKLLSPNSKILFYCHYPDLLLSNNRTGLIKSLYRYPFDQLELYTTGLADQILVNSIYTQSIFKSTFINIAPHLSIPKVLYPSIDFNQYNSPSNSNNTESIELLESEPIYQSFNSNDNIELFVSINRFERKKNIELAIESFAIVYKNNSNNNNNSRELKLIIAGGYDPINIENREYYPELKLLAIKLGLIVSDYPNLTGTVIFLRSFNSIQRLSLFKCASAILYTPSNEHFGIVPIESMYMKRIIIAINSGGPLESIIHQSTGYLCNSSAIDYSQGINSVLSLNKSQRRLMGENGHQRVIENFSIKSFINNLNQIILTMINDSNVSNNNNPYSYRLNFIKYSSIIIILLLAIIISLIMFKL